MQRVLVIGGNGCGKTTLAVQLAQKLGLPLTHLDRLYWQDNWQPVPNAVFDARLEEVLATPRWVLDGNILRTLPRRLACADTVVYMHFSSLRCMAGALKRQLQWYGRSRPDMGVFCPERLDMAFLKSVWCFNKKNGPRIAAALAAAPGVRVVELKNRRQARAFLEKLPSHQ